VPEIGQPKAAVLARRYNLAFGLDIAAITEPVSATRYFDRYGAGLVIDAVDNHAARCEIAQIRGGVLLACGNHDTSGQVSIGSSHDLDVIRAAITRGGDKIHTLPTAYALFPQLLQPESLDPQPISCADALETGEQHLLINDVIALAASTYIYRLLHRQPITSFLTFVGIDGMPVTRSIPITPDNLTAYLPA